MLKVIVSVSRHSSFISRRGHSSFISRREAWALRKRKSRPRSCRFQSLIWKIDEILNRSRSCLFGSLILMESSIFTVILTVNFKGRCKLIEVHQKFSFSDFASEIICTWGELSLYTMKCSFTIGSIKNCCLGCDEDLRNMVLLCQHTNQKIVPVDIINSEKLVNQLVGPNNKVVDQELNCPTSSVSNVSKSKKKLQREPEIEFGGRGSIPSFDMCPTEKRKTYLSDGWADLMKAGVGLELTGGAVEFREDLIKYTTQLGFRFKYLRNNSTYIHVVCNENDISSCEWFIKAKRRVVNSNFIVYKANLIHNCVGKLCIEKNRLRPNIISNLVVQKVRANTSISGKDIVTAIRDDYGIDIPYWKAWKSLEAARNQIFGSYEESYDQLKWYCEAVKRTNPGSVVVLQKNSETCRFERIFIAFKACIEGFRYCRPMLFIDGTFMKGRAKGTMLTATAKDGDNGLFPVAFAVVSAETKDNWAWFLGKLRDELKNDNQVFYISDRNCGLMSAFSEVFDQPVHFFCLYHLLANLKGRFSNGWTNGHREKLGDHFKECAYAPNRRTFNEKVEIFKQVGGKIAEEWLEELPVEKWAIAFSPHIRRYGEMTSNAAESFNSWISEDRSLPITYMIDSIRKKLSRWFVERRESSNLWTGALCASKETLWNHLKEIGKSWVVSECANDQFEVSSKPSVTIDLRLRVCTCYQWQIRGFPCSHAVAVIRKCTSIYSYVEDCFLASNYRNCYKADLNPIPETERYECENYEEKHKILPPNLNRAPGRPKRKREPSYGEFPKNKPTVCPRCFKTGRHDTVTCALPHG